MTCTTYKINSYDITELVDFITTIDGYIAMLVVGLVLGYFISKKKDLMKKE